MEGRTYRYFREEPLYPFGHGLSYSTFAYTNLQCISENITTSDTVTISAEVQNVGARAGDEVVQFYITDLEASAPVPVRKLCGLKRIHLQPGETHTLSFALPPDAFAFVDETGQRVIEPGEFSVAIGGGQPDTHGTAFVSAAITLEGSRRVLA